MAVQLLVEHPDTYLSERQYIFQVLLGEFLGVEYETRIIDQPIVRITRLESIDKKKLRLTDTFFQTPDDQWLAAPSLPEQPLTNWDVDDDLSSANLIENSLPVIYGREPFYARSENVIDIGLDIFGSCFFQLTRYEEMVKSDLDSYERFPASASLAFQEGFLERPLVNEYVELLWATLQSLWPGIKREPREPRVFMSHDVDFPFCSIGLPLTAVLRQSAGDILKRRQPRLALQRMQSYFQTRRGNLENDICNTFDFIMDVAEERGFQSEFYFIPQHSGGEIDGYYSLDDPEIRQLIRRINRRGHRFGYHGSYNTFLDPKTTKDEVEVLLNVLEEEGVVQAGLGGRQHFLRWRNPATWQNWADAGMAFDSTLGFSEHIGFRSGTCYEYPVFNLFTREQLSLCERPLVVMDITLFPGYGHMNLAWDEAVSRSLALYEVCKMLRGDFTFLWHNNHLVTPQEKDCFQSILAAITDN